MWKPVTFAYSSSPKYLYLPSLSLAYNGSLQDLLSLATFSQFQSGAW